MRSLVGGVWLPIPRSPTPKVWRFLVDALVGTRTSVRRKTPGTGRRQKSTYPPSLVLANTIPVGLVRASDPPATRDPRQESENSTYQPDHLHFWSNQSRNTVCDSPEPLRLTRLGHHPWQSSCHPVHHPFPKLTHWCPRCRPGSSRSSGEIGPSWFPFGITHWVGVPYTGSSKHLRHSILPELLQARSSSGSPRLHGVNRFQANHSKHRCMHAKCRAEHSPVTVLEHKGSAISQPLGVRSITRLTQVIQPLKGYLSSPTHPIRSPRIEMYGEKLTCRFRRFSNMLLDGLSMRT